MAPKERWMQYKYPEDAGFSSAKLEKAKEHFREGHSVAVLVIRHGAIVVGWGEISRRFRCHSIRKSLLSCLYGILASEGTIDLNATLADLGIDDEPRLNEAEKQACVLDLLKSQSGVYHDAAYESPDQRASRPERGSHPPGTHYWYNNWDFNALCTILERQTKESVFELFRKRVAVPLQMEEFRLLDTNYLWEPQSQHPAYLFRMSAKDLGRFGTLYLNRGQWNGAQILPPEWVDQSTTPWSGGKKYEFGLCWNIYGPESGQGRWHDLGMYISVGTGHHYVAVIPKLDLVIVDRADSFAGGQTPTKELWERWDFIVNALEDSPSTNPDFVPLVDPSPNITLPIIR